MNATFVHQEHFSKYSNYLNTSQNYIVRLLVGVGVGGGTHWNFPPPQNYVIITFNLMIRDFEHKCLGSCQNPPESMSGRLFFNFVLGGRGGGGGGIPQDPCRRVWIACGPFHMHPFTIPKKVSIPQQETHACRKP